MIPEAFAEKTADTNVPESIDWSRFEETVSTAIERGKREGKSLILVENFLLCNSEALLNLLDKVIFLDHRNASDNLLLQRKWERAHLGKKSYKDRGVSLHDYELYWRCYVLQRYEDHACLSRLPPHTLRLDCADPPEAILARARASLLEKRKEQ